MRTMTKLLCGMSAVLLPVFLVAMSAQAQDREQLCVESASASSKAETEAQRVENMKARVLKLAVSKEANILVTLRDKTKVIGFISDAGEDSFVLTDPKAATDRTVAYSNVTQVQRKRAPGWKIYALIVALGLSLAATFVP